MLEGRSKKAFKDWLGDRDQAWRDGIEVVAMDGFAGFKTATTEELPEAVSVMDPFHVVRLAGDALNECRRRVQQELHGHRGRKGDPLYTARRTLHTGADLLTDKQQARLESLFAVEEHVAVEVTWGIYQRMVHRSDQWSPRASARLRSRVPQPHQLCRPSTPRGRWVQAPATPCIVKSRSCSSACCRRGCLGRATSGILGCPSGARRRPGMATATRSVASARPTPGCWATRVRKTPEQFVALVDEPSEGGVLRRPVHPQRGRPDRRAVRSGTTWWQRVAPSLAIVGPRSRWGPPGRDQTLRNRGTVRRSLLTEVRVS
jgi:hypothetical protein